MLALPYTTFVGNFYVGLTAKLFGGKIVANNRENDGASNPDVIKPSARNPFALADG